VIRPLFRAVLGGGDTKMVVVPREAQGGPLIDLAGEDTVASDRSHGQGGHPTCDAPRFPCPRQASDALPMAKRGDQPKRRQAFSDREAMAGGGCGGGAIRAGAIPSNLPVVQAIALE